MADIAGLIAERLNRPAEDRMLHYRGEWIDRGWVRAFAEDLDATLDQLGLDPGAPVGLAPHTRPEFIAALLALLERRRSIVMIYAYQSPEAMARKLRELELPVVIAAAEQWPGPMLAAAQAVGTAAISLARAAPTVQCLAPGRPSAERHPRQAPIEAGVELLTSGTTGAPKHFPISYARLFNRMVLDNSTAGAARVPGLLFFPLGNISGLYVLLPLIAADSPVMLLDKFEVAGWLDYVNLVRPTVANLPPAAFRMIIDAGVEPQEIASIRYIATGAATLDPALRREFEGRYGAAILQSYGATEFGGVVAAMTPELLADYGPAKADSVGRSWGGASWRVVDVNSGEPLPADQPGRLEVWAPNMAEDWIPTTDLCAIDADGFLYHLGRLDGAIMRGGFKIIPEQVAEALCSHPAVAAAAVVGLPDARLGETPAAAVQLREGVASIEAAGLDAHLRERLPSTMLPSRYLVLPDLPRTPSLKVDLAALRRLFSEAVDAGFWPHKS